MDLITMAWAGICPIYTSSRNDRLDQWRDTMNILLRNFSEPKNIKNEEHSTLRTSGSR